MNEDLTVIIVDDHSLIGEMLAAELTSTGVIAEATDDPGKAAELARRLHPDVAVLDIDLNGVSGFDVAGEVMKQSPGTRLLMLSAFVRDTYVEQSLRMRVAGYLSKSEPLSAVLEAIEAVALGERRFSKVVRERIVIGPAGATIRTSRSSLLTEREREVLCRVARGQSQKQIARSIGISIKTVQHHLAHVMDKLGIHDRVELARFAIREGIIEP